MKAIIAFLYLFTSNFAMAEISDPTTKTTGLSGQEFYVGKGFGKPLMTVNLVSGVTKPGVYHIPVDTSLPELLAYSGGARSNAELDDVSIRRKDEVLKVDLDRALTSNNQVPNLQDQDVVYISQSNVDSGIKWLTIVSTTVSIILSVALIDQAKRD